MEVILGSKISEVVRVVQEDVAVIAINSLSFGPLPLPKLMDRICAEGWMTCWSSESVSQSGISKQTLSRYRPSSSN